MLAFSWYYDIPQHRSHFINSICIVIFLFSLELYCFRDLPTQQYTILALIWTLCGISSSLPSCWTYIHFSFHNPQVYAINSISCSTLSKLVKPLMALSFNSAKPTKGLDVLTPCHIASCSRQWPSVGSGRHSLTGVRKQNSGRIEHPDALSMCHALDT